MFGIGPMEQGVVLLIALVVFGPKKIPEIARALGSSLTEFKKGARDLEKELHGSTKLPEIESPPQTSVIEEADGAAPKR